MGAIDIIYKLLFFLIFVSFIWVIILTKSAQFFGNLGFLAYATATIVTFIVGVPISMILSDTLKDQLESIV